MHAHLVYIFDIIYYIYFPNSNCLVLSLQCLDLRLQTARLQTARACTEMSAQFVDYFVLCGLDSRSLDKYKEGTSSSSCKSQRKLYCMLTQYIRSLRTVYSLRILCGIE